VALTIAWQMLQCALLYSIMDRGDALFMRAMCTTEKIPASLDSMADNLASAMVAFRSQGVNRTFETIEVMGDP
jgi:hypothetical protein